jgi:glycosyltransferase involved in cell wall biosynthesis
MTDPVRVRLGAEGFTKHVGGVRRVSLELAKALSSLGVEVTANDQLLKRVGMSTAQPSGLHRARLQAEELLFPIGSFARSKTGIHHALYYDFLLPSRRWPIVVTMYDMIHEIYGHGSSRLTLAKRQSVRNATAVVAISANTAADAQRILNIKVPVQVVPLGLSKPFLASGETEAPALGVSDEILFVGSRDGYKNFELLLDALAADPRLRDLRLAVVGGKDPSASELAHWTERLGQHRLRYVGRASDQELRDLYRSSAAFVLPSRYEGFGLPLLEAMATGCPVACSNGGSLPEVANGHAQMFDAQSVLQCADAILTAVSMGQQAQKAARTYALEFTWERSARAYCSIYETIHERGL